MTTKVHGVIKGHLDLLYDLKGHGDLCGLFDIFYDGDLDIKRVYDPKRSRGHHGDLCCRFYLEYDPKSSRGHYRLLWPTL